MQNAWFIVRDDMVASTMMTCMGPFDSEETAKTAAATILQAGSYTIWSNATRGKAFTVTAPVINFK